MSDEKIKKNAKIWQQFLAMNYKDNEANVLAALVATLFAKGIITREELDSLEDMLKSKKK